MSMPLVHVGPDLFETLTSHISGCPKSRELLNIYTPFDGSVLGKTPRCNEADVQYAVNQARAAQPRWSATPIGERSRIFLRFHDLLLDRQDEVLDLIQLEVGKARRHAFEEILDTAGAARHYALHAERLLRPRRRQGAMPWLTRTWEFRVPVGVVGFISPWNYPLNLAITDAIPALLAGNAAVLRPDPQTSFTALWAVALLREAGLPADVLAVVTGEGPVIGPAMGARVDFLMFTGSSETGKIVGRQAAERLIGCSLELGGKNPMLVLRDADMDATVEGAVRGSFVGAGQVCISIERIYVDERLFATFLERFADRTKRLRIGAAMDYSTDLGSLASERQLRKVEEHVGDARTKGATVVTGGRRLPDLGPLFYEPTILTGVGPGMKAYEEETFGPVVSVYPFATEEEALARANASRYGLSASIWSRDTARAVRLAQEIRAGSVNVNEPYAATWASVDSPAGGMKESGLWPRHGREGILKFTQPQTVAVQRIIPLGPRPGEDAGAFARRLTRLVKWRKRLGF
jgi:succinate-semialdehyde dehydrogenase / glutarate-semialdehyde dehydrogenase